jgi:hypothetical protein
MRYLFAVCVMLISQASCAVDNSANNNAEGCDFPSLLERGEIVVIDDEFIGHVERDVLDLKKISAMYGANELYRKDYAVGHAPGAKQVCLVNGENVFSYISIDDYRTPTSMRLVTSRPKLSDELYIGQDIKFFGHYFGHESHEKDAVIRIERSDTDGFIRLRFSSGKLTTIEYQVGYVD